MKYIKKEDLVNSGFSAENTDIDALIEIASISVNKATLTRIEKRGFDNLTPKQQELIKKATIEQAKYITNEDDEISNVTSYHLDDISINLKDNEEIYQKLKLSKNAYLFLQETGLMHRGC